ncbi:MAG: hypothetical protein L0K73_13230, partial [Corynebacterium variabile]|nr:hypothetical protein [Corynebacterium variabile]
MNRSTRIRRRQIAAVPAALTATVLLLAGCSSDSDSSESSDSAATTAEPEAVDAAEPRILTTYDGGILTLDANTLDVISDEKIEGFNRLNPVGDGRHAMVSTAAGFQLFDAGVWTEDHGEHTHSYAADPELTDVVYGVDTPGHVVRHHGKTILLSDGDGKI